MAGNIIRIIAILSAACLAMAVAPAAAQTLTPSAAGTYSTTTANNSGGSGTPLGNLLTGNTTVGGDYRGYLIYDVPAGPAFTSATLSLNAGTIGQGPNTINVYDVSTVPSTIAAATATPGTTYTDLGTGVVFGTAVATTNYQTLTISLSPAAITAINAARGSSIAFGFNNESESTTDDFVFGASFNGTPRDLILVAAAPVPTLSEWAMILLGLALAGGAAFVIQRRQSIA